MSSTAKILIADDAPDIREALRLLLKGQGFRTESVESPAAVLAALQAQEFNLVLLDLNFTRDTTSGAEGLELLPRIAALDSTLPVVIMTAWGTVEIAVEAMRQGARDFVEKPWDNERLLAIVRNQIELRRALRHEQRLEAETRLLRAEGRPELIADSAAMRPLLQLITQVAPSDANILITGENGTGKELVAKTIHALSRRAQRSLVTVNLGGLPEGIFESELFGHVRGAFTDAKADRVGRFELADSGTLFLDEIGNLGMAQQAKLLRTVQSGEMERVGSSKTRRVDVRLIAATNADLNQQVAEGRFRQDLLFRINTIEIHVPPLRQRREDIAALANHFLRQHVGRYQKSIVGFEPAAVQVMQEHPWPGNVRELEHAIERAVLLATADHIQASDLGLRPAAAAALPSLEAMPLDEAERILVRTALERAGGNIHQAAKALGLSRAALYRRIERYGL
ncbi:MAG TPA: sigma-54 dependent transcriptional regulator [Terriglobales bacterium]|nr:sigma-54 dependent transcriptional regulator [Terriglobales bacterium]